MKALILTLAILSTAASFRDYRYVGVAGDVVVTTDGQKTSFSRIGDVIFGTDIVVQSVSQNGIMTSKGFIPLMHEEVKPKTEAEIKEDEKDKKREEINEKMAKSRFFVGDCFNMKDFGVCSVYTKSSNTEFDDFFYLAECRDDKGQLTSERAFTEYEIDPDITPVKCPIKEKTK